MAAHFTGIFPGKYSCEGKNYALAERDSGRHQKEREVQIPWQIPHCHHRQKKKER